MKGRDFLSKFLHFHSDHDRKKPVESIAALIESSDIDCTDASLLSFVKRESVKQEVSLMPHQMKIVARLLSSEELCDQTVDLGVAPAHDDNVAAHLLPPFEVDIDQLQVKGALLCDHMGSGKTLAVLFYLFLSQGRLSQAMPFAAEVRSAASPPPLGPVPSLQELALTRIKSLPLVPRSKLSLEMQRAFADITPPCYRQSPARRRGLVRSSALVSEREASPLFLSRSSLIALPTNLIHQWLEEMKKFQLLGSVSILSRLNEPLQETLLDSSKLTVLVWLPRAPQVSIEPFPIYFQPCFFERFDIVITSHDLISRLNISGEKRKRSSFESSHGESSSLSPLLRIHWKRIICDEGANLVNHSSISLALQTMQCDFRLIISATPTTSEEKFPRYLDLLSGGALPRAQMKRAFDAARPNHSLCLQALARFFLIKNSTNLVMRELPKVESHLILVDLKPHERFRYDCVAGEVRSNIELTLGVDQDSLFHESQAKPAQEALFNLHRCTVSTAPISYAERLRCAENCLVALKRVNPTPDKPCHTTESRRAVQSIHDFMMRMSPDEEILNLESVVEEKRLERHVQLEKEAQEATSLALLRAVERRVRDSRKKGEAVVEELDEPKKREIRRQESRKHFLNFQESVERNIQNRIQLQSQLVACNGCGIWRESLPYCARYSRCNIMIGRNRPKSFCSTKVDTAFQLIYRHVLRKEKVILFTNVNDTMSLMLEALDMSGLTFGELHSRSTNREETVKRFCNPQDNMCVLVMKLSMTAKGLNLQSASAAIFLDRASGNANLVQAMARSVRLGRKEPVHLYHLVARDTVDEDDWRKRFNQHTNQLVGSSQPDSIREALRKCCQMEQRNAQQGYCPWPLDLPPHLSEKRGSSIDASVEDSSLQVKLKLLQSGHCLFNALSLASAPPPPFVDPSLSSSAVKASTAIGEGQELTRKRKRKVTFNLPSPSK